MNESRDNLRLCCCAVWDFCGTAGAEESASSLEVTLLALCCFGAESSPQGGRNELAKDSLGPLFTLNPLRTIVFIPGIAGN